MRYCFFMLFFFCALTLEAAELSVENKVRYKVKFAQTEEELTQGLMNIHHLPQNEGMLFDLRDYPYTAMWMKNTYISLDMLFLDCSFYVVDAYENAKPLSLKKISSDKDFCYVLEINGGEFKKHQMNIGDKVFVDGLL